MLGRFREGFSTAGSAGAAFSGVVRCLGRRDAQVLEQAAKVAQNSVGDDLHLRLAALADIERGVELTEGAHRLLAELQQLLHLAADTPICDRAQDLGERSILGGLGQRHLSFLVIERAALSFFTSRPICVEVLLNSSA